jgi:hypothetical protein
MKVDLSGPTTSIENGEAAGSKLGQVETAMAEHVLQLGEDVRDYARYCVELMPNTGERHVRLLKDGARVHAGRSEGAPSPVQRTAK